MPAWGCVSSQWTGLARNLALLAGPMVAGSVTRPQRLGRGHRRGGGQMLILPGSRRRARGRKP